LIGSGGHVQSTAEYDDVTIEMDVEKNADFAYGNVGVGFRYSVTNYERSIPRHPLPIELATDQALSRRVLLSATRGWRHPTGRFTERRALRFSARWGVRLANGKVDVVVEREHETYKKSALVGGHRIVACALF
jgi:hypothetical protein